MGSMATSDCVHIYRVHFQERDGKDQRKTQMQSLGVSVPSGH